MREYCSCNLFLFHWSNTLQSDLLHEVDVGVRGYAQDSSDEDIIKMGNINRSADIGMS